MDINGAENLAPHELAAEIQRGARVIEFGWVVSLVIVTLRRSSMVLVRPGTSFFAASFPYNALSLCAGWWGFPFGLIFTPVAIFKNLNGGRDLTASFASQLPPGVGHAPPTRAPTAMVSVVAPDGRQSPAQLLARQNGSARVRFPNGHEEWVPDHAVRGLDSARM